MKYFSTILFVLLVSVQVCANDKSSKWAQMRLAVVMEKLQSSGEHLEAMDSATLLLSLDHENRAAINFVYRHWDKTMEQTTDKLSTLTDESSLDQAKERLDIYRLLDEIHLNLRSVPMPFYGPNNRWVWQPEVNYFTGTYDTERIRVFKLVMAYADDALRSFEVGQAAEHISYALNDLLLESERESNRKLIVQDLEKRVAKLRESTNIYNVIASYDIAGLALSHVKDGQHKLALTNTQVAIRERIEQMYREAAAAALEQGDSIGAYNFNLSADDWK